MAPIKSGDTLLN